MAACDCRSNQIHSDNIAAIYIRKDLHKVKAGAEDSPIIFVDPIDDSYLYLEAVIQGPLSTPYENDIFLIYIKLSSQFPFAPPESITFKSAIIHPNVDEYGRFMSKLLKADSWTPAFTIKDILEHIWICLAIPYTDSNERDLDHSHLERTDLDGFQTTERECSVKCASSAI